MEQSVDCVIIGAGVGGLTLAYTLKQRGFSVLLIDSSPRVGGVIQTAEHGNYLLEFGPNSTLSKAAFQQICSALKLEHELVSPQGWASNRYIALESSERQRLVPTPKGLKTAITSPLLSTQAKLRLLLEPFRAASRLEDEDVRTFVTRRLGPDVANTLVAAMLGGIWAADISKLSCRSALPRIWEMEKASGSLLRGMFQASGTTKHNKQPRAHILSFRMGMETLVAALSPAIGKENIHTSTSLIHFQKDFQLQTIALNLEYSKPRQPKEFQTLRAKHVVFALPAEATAEALDTLEPTLAAQIRSIPHAPLGVTHLAFRKDQVSHPLDGFGFLVPPKNDEHRLATLGAIFSSSLFPGRAPESRHLLTCFSGGAVNPDLADVTHDRICDRVILEISRLIGASGKADVLATTYYPRAIPNYAVGHFQLQSAIDHFESTHKNIHILGNWVRGISVADRIEQAQLLAERILQNEQAPANQIDAISHHPGT